MRKKPDSISSFIPGFKQYMETGTRLLPLTRQAYIAEITRFAGATQKQYVSDITPLVLQEFFAMLHNAWGAQPTIVKKKAALKKFFSYLEDFHGNNHAALLAKTLDKIQVRSLRTGPVREPYALTQEQFEKMLNAAGEHLGTGARDRAIIHVLWSTGVRRAELASLSLSQTDLENRTAVITGKRDKTRTIVFSEACRQDILAWLAVRPRWGPVCDNVFTTALGSSVGLQTVNSLIKRIARDAGLRKDVYPHIFRHSALSRLLDGKMTIQDAALLAGHSSVNTTFKYFHKDSAKLKEAYDKADVGKPRRRAKPTTE